MSSVIESRGRREHAVVGQSRAPATRGARPPLRETSGLGLRNDTTDERCAAGPTTELNRTEPNRDKTAERRGATTPRLARSACFPSSSSSSSLSACFLLLLPLRAHRSPRPRAPSSARALRAAAPTTRQGIARCERESRPSRCIQTTDALTRCGIPSERTPQ